MAHGLPGSGLRSRLPRRGRRRSRAESGPAGLNSAEAAAAANLRQYLLPNLAAMAEPLGTNPAYRLPDGTFDLRQRFQELEAADPDLAALDPPADFKQAARFYQEQRFLTIGLILLAASLFWLGMAEISPGRTRFAPLVIGLILFLGTIAFLVVVEGLFIFLKGVLS